MRLILILVALFLSKHSFSQELSRIIAASNEVKTSSFSVSWTIGEVFNEDFQSASLLVSQGLNSQNFNYLITGIEPQSQNKVEVYPLPFINDFIVTSNLIDLSQVEISIIGLDGRQIQFDLLNLTQNQLNISTQELAPGLYFVRITPNKDNKSYSIKLLKK
jgi:hypothetical protein